MKIKISLKNIILFICLFMLGLNYLIYNAIGIDSYKNLIRFISITISLFYLIYFKSGKLNVVSFILLLLSIVNFIFGNLEALNLFTFVIFANILSDRIDIASKEICLVYSCLIIIMLFLLVTKTVENVTYFGLEGRKRSTLGFNNPNVASLFYTMYILIFILQSKKLNITQLIIGEVFGYFIYFYTDSRTSFLVVSIFILLMLINTLFRRKSILKKIYIKSLIVIIDLFYILNIFSMLFINRFYSIDKLLSFRISHFNNSLSSLSILNILFGNARIEVDSFYYVIFLSFGIFFYILIMYLTHTAATKLFNSGNWKYIIFLFSISLLGLTESGAYRIEILTFILFWKILVANFYSHPKNTKISPEC